MLKVFNCIADQHDLRLVALSAAICALGCFTTVSMLARSRSARSRTRTAWLIAAAAVFGSSVWSLHFVAMLAFLPAANMAYSLDLTVASMLVAFGGALLAFSVWRSHIDGRVRTPISGLLLGLAVSGMHYVGVDGMRFSGLVFFDRGMVIASVAAAILFAIVALARSTSLSSVGRRVEITGWLALSICSLHFTGMAAMTLSPGVADDGHSAVLGTSTLAAIVGIVSLALLVVSLAAVLLDQHLSQRAHKELGRMRLLSNLAHEVLLIYRDGIVLEANNAAERLFKASADDLIGRQLTTLFAPDSVPALARRSAIRAEDRRAEELEVQTSVGTHVPVEFSCQPIEFMGKPATAVALRDLTERKRDEAQIRHLARHDALTNLPNRYTLQERLEQALDSVSRDASSLAVVYLDLDRFKPVNDLYGHAAGDQLLIQVSKRVLAEILPGDTLARIGGDEFVLILKGGIAPDRVATIADRILATLSRPFQIENNRVEIGASIGIALYPGDGGSADTLLRAADTAMYRVKDEGRGSIRFFETSMDDQLQVRRQLEQELGHAIERDELLLHYQPLVNGVTGEVETFEALIRWQHAERGLIPPMDFIPLAEGTGQINAIGKWVIDTACAAAASWSHPWRVSVNVSPTQFRQSDVCAVVAAALARNNLDPSRLVVEITESVLIGETAKAVQVLERLRSMGIRLALDDFGTGYSSLSYLQKFRFDKIKVDKSFVQRLGQDEESRTIARTIVNLGHNLGLQVTAEGVETVQQLACLQELGCDQIQGFLVARPLPMDFFTELDRARVRGVFKRRERLSA